MPNSTREALGWSEERWTIIQGAIERAIARTAKCRQVVPKGPEKIGDKSDVVPQIGGALPFAYAPDIIATPVHIFVNLRLDDQHINDELAVIRLVEASAARLGALEDEEVILGGPALLAGAPAPPPPPPQFGRQPRTAGLQRARLNVLPPVTVPPAPPGVTKIKPPRARAGKPTGDELLAAISTAKALLENAGRPGACGLLLSTGLLATLGLPPVAGAPPLIQTVEQIIGSSEVVGTSALDGTFAPNAIAAILFRLEPAAVDTVHTMLPAATFLGRNGGQTDLQVEEEIVVRILDQTAIHHIAY